MKTSELFTNEEKEKIAKKYKDNIRALESLKHSIDVLYSDFALAEEENRILKKHFNVTPEMYFEIEKKYVKNRQVPAFLSPMVAKTKHQKQ